MAMKRRAFLSNTAMTGLAVAFSSVFKTAAAATALSQQQYAALCQRWGDIITGRQSIDPNDAKYVEALAALDRKVASVLDELIRTPNRKQVFASANLDDGNSRAITKTARHALTLATGWATPGSTYYGNADILQDAIHALRDFLSLRYHAGQEEYDNWWDWESGAARAVGDMMCLLQKELPSDVMANASEAIRYFIPDPWFLRTSVAPGTTSDVASTELVASTGANRVDLCRAVICQAIASGDAPRVRHALLGLPEIWAFVDEGDGFYRDGSFIQHQHVPYTGSYGGVLLDGWAKLFTLVSGSEFAVSDEQRETVYQRVEEAFVPVIVDGQVLDCVRGRSVSRMNENAANHGKSIILAMLQVAQGSSPERANKWKAICRGWMTRNHYDDFTKGNRISAIALLNDALASGKDAPAPTKPIMFSSMDRLVHRSEGWRAAIAMCSKRIAWYECGNGENNWGSRTGSGMRYLLLPNDMGQYEDGFWPTLDYAAPTGTTVDTHPLEAKAAGEWGHETPQNEWTGGLVQDQYSLAGMQLIGPDDNGLQARRTWLGTPWGMIEAVSDVHTNADHALSVVEHRNLGEQADASLLVDGQEITDEATLENPKWAYLDGVGGYVFLTPVTLHASIAQRSGTWADINERAQSEQAKEVIKRFWASMHVRHAAQNNAAAWLLLPTKDRATTEQIAQVIHGQNGADPHAVKLLQNDAAAQVLAVGEDITGWSIWQAGQYADWQFDQPMVVFARRDGDTLHVSVADPTQAADEISLVVPDMWSLNAVDGIALSHEDGQTRLTVDTRGREGRSLDCVLTKTA